MGHYKAATIMGLGLLAFMCAQTVLGQVSFGGGGSRSSNNGFRTSSNRRQSTSTRIQQQRAVCRTVSGPDSNKDCVFPFTHKGVTYRACPKGPASDPKPWCSTETDSRGNHITGQNKFGHCGSGCPLHDEPRRQAASSSSNSRPVSNNNNPASSNSNNNSPAIGGSCSGSEQCRPVAVCALRFSNSQVSKKACVRPDKSQGLCCSEITRNRQVNILPSPELGLRGSENPIPNTNVRNAVSQGQSFLSNVTSNTRSVSTRASQGSPTFFQGKNSRRKTGVKELNDLAIISAGAVNSLQNDGSLSSNEVGTRQADVFNTVLSGCFEQPSCDFNSKFRTPDGSCNSRFQPLLGKLKTPLQRVMRNDYADGLRTPRVNAFGTALPSARLISTSTTNSFSNPSRRVSALLMSFGQFVDHDLSHVPNSGVQCCDNNGNFNFNNLNNDGTFGQCMPIRIPGNDPFFRKSCMNFVRSDGCPKLDCSPGSLEQINQITHWLDASNIYGSDKEEADGLRSFQGGRLKSTPSSFGRELLPNANERGDCKGQSSCFKAGDGRNSEQPNLAIMHTLFMREHNRVAGQLQALNSHWADERIYLEARRIVSAEFQHIVYNEFLPVLLGDNYVRSFGLLPLTSGFSRDYLDNIDARITNEFATAAYRVGHTFIPTLINLFATVGNQLGGSSVRQSGSSGTRSFRLKDQFFVPDLLRTPGAIDGLLKGLTQSPVENAENSFAEDISENLFDGATSGMDLIALNIQRGRDHGLPGYIHYRRICQVDNQLATSFDQLSNTISRQNINQLRSVYNNVEDIDLYTGMYMETPGFNGAFVGRTFLCLIGDQFARLKKGDRFFYDLSGQSGSFTEDQLNSIRSTSFSRIICDNTDNINEMQPLAFQLVNSNVNALTSCNSFGIPRVNLNPFADRRGSSSFGNGNSGNSFGGTTIRRGG